jgi:hypothetical protein
MPAKLCPVGLFIRPDAALLREISFLNKGAEHLPEYQHPERNQLLTGNAPGRK